MKRAFLIVLIAALVVVGVGFTLGPWLSFRALRAAAVANDSAGIAQVVDYYAARTALHAQLDGAQAHTPPPSVWQDPLGALGRLLGDPIQAAKVNVDSYLTPEALTNLTQANNHTRRAKDEDWMAGDLIPGLHGSEVRYWDPGRARNAARYPGHLEVIFTFERRSLTSWKLVHIRLPAPRNAPPPPSPAARDVAN